MSIIGIPHGPCGHIGFLATFRARGTSSSPDSKPSRPVPGRNSERLRLLTCAGPMCGPLFDLVHTGHAQSRPLGCTTPVAPTFDRIRPDSAKFGRFGPSLARVELWPDSARRIWPGVDQLWAIPTDIGPMRSSLARIRPNPLFRPNSAHLRQMWPDFGPDSTKSARWRPEHGPDSASVNSGLGSSPIRPDMSDFCQSSAIFCLIYIQAMSPKLGLTFAGLWPNFGKLGQHRTKQSCCHVGATVGQ